ncbi:MAG: protein-S-isoprenylcysteine O-methyltransferase Ste14 [Candidatus Omnitrophota bacterium]|jgi:protein-S-isoprenylcysteine O-methyltransferase Ste14
MYKFQYFISVTLISSIYWVIVLGNAWRIKKTLGKTPHIKPIHRLESLLWVGWLSILLSWYIIPLGQYMYPEYYLFKPLIQHNSLIVGLIVSVVGLLGTLWSYGVFGLDWAISSSAPRNQIVMTGPYAMLRHPIYGFQFLVFLGCCMVVSCWAALMVMALHAICIHVKALDEEKALSKIFGHSYQEYCSKTPRFIPAAWPQKEMNTQ